PESSEPSPSSQTDAALQPVAPDIPSPAFAAFSPPPASLSAAPSTRLPSSLPAAASAAAPAATVLPGAAPVTALTRGPGGPSKETVALIGVICAAILIRYLSYSTKLRRL
ncbi:MAG: hypothetical protein LC792_29410, partial [Actinobacteria bacterium]|nr:hypothetical protein [Actinomycetota bacterium]